MAESYPSFESGSHESKGNKNGGKPEFNASKRIEKSAGDTPLKFGDKILNARPLDGELFKPTERPGPEVAETPKQPEATQHERAEREDWRPVSARELHERAVADQQVSLEDMHKQEHAAEGGKDSKDETKNSKKRVAEVQDIEAVKPKADPERPASIEEILLPPKSVDGGEAPAAVASPLGPDAEQDPNQPAGTEAAFQHIARAPELADLVAVELPEMDGSPETVAEQEQPTSDDETFRDMVANETGEDPGEARLHERMPGLPPVEASIEEPEPFDQWLQGHPELTSLANTTNAAANSAPGHNGAPNSPGAGGPYGFNPNMPSQPPYGNGGGNQPPGGPSNPNTGAWNNGPNVPNPNALNNPWAPAGNALNPAVLAGMTALEARQRLDSLRHTAREAGLAGAVGILGLGLVIEHFRTSKTRRMLKKQGKEQKKALSKTNKALQQERYAHQATQAKLEHLSAAHNATNEQLRRTAAAANVGKQHGATLPTNEQLAKQLEQDKQLGRAIKRNPELRDIAGLAGSTSAEQGELSREVREAIGANVAADIIDEKRYERLRSKYSDNAGGVQSGGANAQGAPSLPAPQQSADTSSVMPHVQRGNQAANHVNLVNKSVAWATLLVVIAAAVVILIMR